MPQTHTQAHQQTHGNTTCMRTHNQTLSHTGTRAQARTHGEHIHTKHTHTHTHVCVCGNKSTLEYWIDGKDSITLKSH